MNVFALMIAGAGLLSILVGVAVYFSKIKSNTVPTVPVALVASLMLGLILAIMALVVAIPGSWIAVLPVSIVSGVAILTVSVFYYLLARTQTPLGDIKVKVGKTIPPFSVRTHNNEVFTDKDLLGQRTLFKFYRGAWCPYCCAELKMFDALKPVLSQFGVDVVGLSGDRVEDAQNHIRRDGISVPLLADPELNVVKAFGVEHHKTYGSDADKTFTIMGLPFPKVIKIKSMSIPTTLLVDEHGIVRWIDQSEDYRLRANQHRVMAAVEGVFGE